MFFPDLHTEKYQLLKQLCITIAIVITLWSISSASADSFSYDDVLKLAQDLSKQTAQIPTIEAQSQLSNLTYDQYRDIHTNHKYQIWKNENIPFRIEVLPAGFIYKTPVRISIVKNGRVHDIFGRSELFEFGPLLPQITDTILPLSGFRVRTPLNSNSVYDEFLTFQGATYFRALGKNMLYGLSARGLSIHTGDPIGEEFPVFTHFWIEHQSKKNTSFIIYALLESKSVTGAYRFTVTPGVETIMDVDLTLFPRESLTGIGISVLTSMFLFGECDHCRVEDYRSAVHDSDGLQIMSENGEQIWRALNNPYNLQVSYFTTAAPKAFGLFQRPRELSDYQDFEALYNRRPAALIEPHAWGAGETVLVEIPSDNEKNDNIVSFFRPADTLKPQNPWLASYRIIWTAMSSINSVLSKVVATRCGKDVNNGNKLFVIDFDNRTKMKKSIKTELSSSAGEINNVVLQQNPLTRGVRASFDFDPGEATVADLRFRLMQDDKPLSETWLYRWSSK